MPVAKSAPSPLEAAARGARPGGAAGGGPDAQPTPKLTPPMNHQWKCSLSGLEADGKTSAELPEKITVGTKLLAACEGENAADLAREGLRIELNDQETYSLHLLKVLELKESSASFVVVPWRAGELKMTNPALATDTVRVGMGDMELNVGTVIDPKTNPKGEPFPPQHPLTLAWPLWLWLLAGSLVLGLLYLLGLGVRKSMRRKKLLLLLERNATALSPLNHFNKELRRLQRKIPLQGQTWDPFGMAEYFSELDSQFRWFLARELVIPALDGSTRSILRDLRKTDADVYKHSARDLRVALNELGKARATSLTSEDAVQLMDLTRRVADRIAKERNV